MKVVYCFLNMILVVLIAFSIFLKPEEINIPLNNASKSITTTAFIALKDAPVEKRIDTNSLILQDMDEVVEKSQEEPKTETVPASVDVPSEPAVKDEVLTVETDVLETQVGTMSAYGLDCAGCSGRVGARYDAASNNVRYYDSVYGEMRIVAGDKKYPYGTVVRVVNSKIGTFLAIVLDRGGDIGIDRRYMFDLLFYTEAEAYQFGLSRNTTFEILRYGY